jgi:rubrerythrin
MLLDKNDIVTAMRNEAYARCRYEVFAEVAEAQGLHYFAKVLKETADNELSHFREFMRILGLIGSVEENIATAIKDETAEAETMYPRLSEQAMGDGELDTARIFARIAKIEKRHKQRLERMAELLENDSVYARDEPITWKCCVCGYVIDGKEPPNKCPACQSSKNWYVPEDFTL